MQRRERHRDVGTVGLAIHVPARDVQRVTHAFEVLRRDPSTKICKIEPAGHGFPPAGIEGVGPNDRGLHKHGKILFGSLGFGALKLALHRACIARLFEQNDLLLDAEEIYVIAKTMVG